jgi:hypothetical protein
MDVEALHSECHPDLKSAAAPRTERVIATWHRSSKQKRDDAQTESANLSRSLASLKTMKPLKRCRLTAHDAGKAIIDKEIKSDVEFMILAKQQDVEGKADLAQFIYNQTPKKLNDLIATAWKMEMAATILERRNKLRMSVVETALEENCVDGCAELLTSPMLQVQVKSQVISCKSKSSHKSFGLSSSQVKSQVIWSKSKSIQVTSHSEWQVNSSQVTSHFMCDQVTSLTLFCFPVLTYTGRVTVTIVHCLRVLYISHYKHTI